MYSTEALGGSIIIFVFSCIVLYLIIYYAVKSANSDLIYYARFQWRTKIRQLRKEGCSDEEILRLLEAKEKDWWKHFN